MENALAPMRAGQATRTIATGDLFDGRGALTHGLSGQQKAAVIVRLMLSEGAPLPLSALPEHLQTALTEQLGDMRMIDRQTLRAVVEELVDELEGVGLSFPGGTEGALDMLDGHISATAVSRLRRMLGARGAGDPWERVKGLDSNRLVAVLNEESIEVGAVMLSKLPVSKAAEILGRLPGDKARRIAYAVSLTGNVDPETVRRIGLSLATQLDAQPARAFDEGAVERIGAILNFSPASTREEVLKGLMETDADFAEQVKRAIFTFRNIPDRVEARDVSKIIRGVPQTTLDLALASAKGQDQAAAEFILANMSQRLATSLREEMAALGKIKPKEAEEAMNAIINSIREREAAGEINLVATEE